METNAISDAAKNPFARIRTVIKRKSVNIVPLFDHKIGVLSINFLSEMKKRLLRSGGVLVRDDSARRATARRGSLVIVYFLPRKKPVIAVQSGQRS